MRRTLSVTRRRRRAPPCPTRLRGQRKTTTEIYRLNKTYSSIAIARAPFCQALRHRYSITNNRIPDCGRLSPTSYYAHGYSGQGVALAGLYGKLMAEAIRGTAERFDLLSRIRHLPFPGGPIRTPLLAAAMLYYRLKDALG